MVTDVVAKPGNNQVELRWQKPKNADDADVTAYYVTVEPDGRILRVDADRTAVTVTGLKNGVESTFVVYAASERGRGKAAEAVTATPTTGMEGEVAGLIVKFETSVSDGQGAVPGEGRVAEVDLTVASQIADGVHAVELSEAVTKAEAESIADALQQDPNVVWAEPDQFLFVSSNDESAASAVPDDPDYQAKQWNLWDEFGIGLGDGARAMTGAYSPTAGAGVTVAVIDTGITAHPDLDGQLVPGYDFVSDPAELAAPRSDGEAPTSFDADGDPGRDADPTDPGDWSGVAPARDSTWHGTHIAGIIAAKANNAEGITGIAPGAKIQPIRALSWRGGLLSDIIASITWASGGTVEGVPDNANPAEVINMSFAAQAACSVAMQDAITAAANRGTTLVAAAGNANDDASKYTPGNCNDVITVAATGRDGKRAPYSNYGPAISISAPGGSTSTDGGVTSTSNSGRTGPEAATYRSSEGTSIAAAHVSAAAVLLYADGPSNTPSDIRTRLGERKSIKAFADSSCEPDVDKSCGSGIISLAQPAATVTQTVTCGSTANSVPLVVTRSDRLELLPDRNTCDSVRLGTGMPSSSLACQPSTQGSLPVYPSSLGRTSLTTCDTNVWFYDFSAMPADTSTAVVQFRDFVNKVYTSVTITVSSGPPLSDFTTTAVPTIDDTTPVPGETLTASVSGWNPSPSFTYQWKAGGINITGATSSTYTVTASNGGKSITVAVTGTATGYKTTTKESAATSAVPLSTFASTSAPTISGTATIGQTLTASVPAWTPTAAYSYQWKAGGSAISGATSGTYVVTAAEAEKTITVAVTGKATGYSDITLESSPTATVSKGTFSSTPAPTISGTVSIGQTLTASASWTPAAQFTYQWNVAGSPISGANQASYVVRAADVGKAITVTVNGSASGYNSATGTSSPTSLVPSGVFSSKPAPTISGSGTIGQTLSASTSDWTPKQDSFTYQWLAGGSAIAGASSSTYVVTGNEAGKKISVKVTGKKAAYNDAVVESVATSTVPFGTFTSTQTPTITGMLVAGQTLTASTDNWLPLQDSFAYQWLADGQVIGGANSSSYLVAAGDVTKSITVMVTGSATGYTSVSETSVAKVAPLTISFDGNGIEINSSGTPYAPPPVFHEVGTAFMVAKLPEAPVNRIPMTTFLGWYDGDSPVFTYDKASGYGLHSSRSGSWVPASSMTLTAHWERRVYVYDMNSFTGKLCTGSGTSYTVTMTSTSGTPSIVLGIPQGSSEEFVSWYTSNWSSPEPSLEDDSRWPVGDSRKPTRVFDADGTLQGLRVVVDSDLPESICTSWKATLSYSANGGTGTPASEAFYIGAVVSQTPIPRRVGYAFTGWFDAATGGTKVSAGGASSFSLMSSRTLHARWSQDAGAPQIASATLSADRKTISLAFTGAVQDLGNSAANLCQQFRVTSIDSVYPVSRSCVVTGSMLEITSASALSGNAVALDIAYVGAALADASNAASLVSQTADIPVSGVAYVVSFVSHGGVTPSAVSVAIGQSIVLPAAQRGGYDFEGWYTAANGGTRVGGAGAQLTPPSDLTLHAQWREASPPPAPQPSTPPPPRIPDLPPPPRVEIEQPAVTQVSRPAVVVVDGAITPIVVTRDDVEVGLDVVGEDFSLAIATSDTEKVRVAPTSRDSLVAPVQGWVDVQATGYAERSSVSVFLIPKLAARMSARASDDPYYLGQAVVGEDAKLIGEFRLPDWASVGEYTLQINGYTPTGSVRSINVDLDLIDVRQESIVTARACVFPESTVKLSDECRRGLRSLKALFPSDAPSVNIAITGVAYGQGSKAMNRSVARERADRIKAYLERLGVDAEVTVDVVLRKGLAPGLDVTPPPVVTSSDGKPASTVLLEAVWQVEVGPGSART